MNNESVFTGERFVPGVNDDEITIEHYQRYESIRELVKDKVVVDAACGEGYGTSIIGSVAKSVTGFDISKEAVARARENYGADNVRFEVGDVSNLPITDNSVDVFVSFETIEHVTQELQVKFVNEVSRILKDDGMLIISSPNKAIYSDLFDYNNEFHVHEMYKQEFMDLLSSKFKYVKLFNQYLEVASLIDSNDNQCNTALYFKNKERYVSDGKYFIAVVSNHPVDTVEIQSVFLRHDVTYRKNIKRILELQNDVEERNAHIHKLDEHIEELDANIRHYTSREQELEREKEGLLKNIIKISEEKEGLLKNTIKIGEEKEELLRTVIRVGEEKNTLNQQMVDLKENFIKQIDSLNELAEVLRRDSLEITRDNQAKQEYIENLERICEERRIELDKIRYYKKHPVRRLYRIFRRIGGKAWRKVKPMLKSFLPEKMNYKKFEVPTFKNPKVSIIIPVYNEFDYTYACIRSIVDTVKDVSYEIIIGDDESKDATRKIKQIIKNVKVNVNHTDNGFLMNCNRAAKLACGEYIIFLNNDTLVKEDWLESLVELIESDDTIGMVGSKFVYPDGRLQEAGGIVWKDASAWNYGRYQDADMPEFNYVRETDYISGASIMIKKNLWDEIGGFDERFKPAYCEDSDLAFEVRKHGYKVMYQPKSVVVHFEGVSNGTELDAGLKKYQVENNVKFKEKWEKELEQHNENGENPFCMRERNYDKKVVLFIDHYVPTYDKDAGSKTTFQYIKMFLKKGYIVKFIGDNYAKMEPYTTTLQQMGVEVLYGPWYAQHIFEWIEANKDSIDFAYLNRPHISVKYLDFLREKTDIKLIYYGHDLHFLRMQREAELTGNEELLAESKDWRVREFDIMKKVSRVYYPSAVEEKAIHEIDATIPVKAITAYVFDKFKENYRYEAEKREGILFVGGFSHGPNVDAVKWFVNEVYTKIREKADIPFIIVGSNAPEEIQVLDGNGIVFKGFVSDEELADLYASSKMVVVPLRYGAGVKGKVVEAIYNGLPIVTTSVGAEGIPGVEDVLCIEDSAEDFAQMVTALYEDKGRLTEMAEKTQRFIKDNFSVDAVWDIIKDDFS